MATRGTLAPGRGKKTDSDTTGFIGRGSTYIRAKLERDGHTQELAVIERGETTAKRSRNQARMA
jgi:hypothetical protein